MRARGMWERQTLQHRSQTTRCTLHTHTDLSPLFSSKVRQYVFTCGGHTLHPHAPRVRIYCVRVGIACTSSLDGLVILWSKVVSLVCCMSVHHT